MNEEFTAFDPEKWPRRRHFLYYTGAIRTSYIVNVQMDVTKLRRRCRHQGYRFYPSMIYAIMRAVNAHEEFRMSLDKDGNPGYYAVCHPSYTIFHKDDQTFSDIWTPWNPDFLTFYQAAVQDMERYADVKGPKAKPDRPDAFVPISDVPWLSFEGVSHDSPASRDMYFPVIVFGKYHKEDGKWRLPFSLMVNHAAADGFHASRLLLEIEDNCRHCKDWMPKRQEDADK